MTPPSAMENMDKQLQEPFSFSDGISPGYGNNGSRLGLEPGEPQMSRALSNKSRSTKSKSAAAGRIGTAKASSSSSFLALYLSCIQSNTSVMLVKCSCFQFNTIISCLLPNYTIVHV